MDLPQATLQAALDNKTKPPGSLGDLESLALRIGQLQQTCQPSMDRCELIIFAADHGIAASGVSQYPQEVTRQMVQNFLSGGAAANVMARSLDVEVQIVDAGVAADPITNPNLLDRKIARGTRNLIDEPAMTKDQFEAALAAGRELGQKPGLDAFCFGEMGIANTSSATLLFHKIIGLSIETLAGRGTGLDDAGLARKRTLLERASARVSRALAAEEVMQEYGGFEIAMMCGAMLGAARSGRIVIVDGFIATAAALVATRLEPVSREAMVFAHQSAEKGHALALRSLNAQPLFDFKMRLGEGTGALLAWPIVKCAAAVIRDMASFESAGISGPA